jgi:hypothetical protein
MNTSRMRASLIHYVGSRYQEMCQRVGICNDLCNEALAHSPQKT